MVAGCVPCACVAPLASSCDGRGSWVPRRAATAAADGPEVDPRAVSAWIRTTRPEGTRAWRSNATSPAMNRAQLMRQACVASVSCNEDNRGQGTHGELIWTQQAGLRRVDSG